MKRSIFVADDVEEMLASSLQEQMVDNTSGTINKVLRIGIIQTFIYAQSMGDGKVQTMVNLAREYSQLSAEEILIIADSLHELSDKFSLK